MSTFISFLFDIFFPFFHIYAEEGPQSTASPPPVPPQGEGCFEENSDEPQLKSEGEGCFEENSDEPQLKSEGGGTKTLEKKRMQDFINFSTAAYIFVLDLHLIVERYNIKISQEDICNCFKSLSIPPMLPLESYNDYQMRFSKEMIKCLQKHSGFCQNKISNDFNNRIDPAHSHILDNQIKALFAAGEEPFPTFKSPKNYALPNFGFFERANDDEDTLSHAARVYKQLYIYCNQARTGKITQDPIIATLFSNSNFCDDLHIFLYNEEFYRLLKKKFPKESNAAT